MRYTLKVLFVGLIGSLTGLVMGYDLGIIGVVLTDISKDLSLCPEGEKACFIRGLAVGLTSPGAAIGSLSIMYVTRRIGPRRCFSLSAVFILLGFLMMAFSSEKWPFLVGRFVAGIGVGIGFSAGPTYLSEVAPQSLKGTFVMLLEVCLCIGILVAYAVVRISSTADFGWQWLIHGGAIIAGVQLAGVLFLPESPVFLRSKGRECEAASVEYIMGFDGTSESEGNVQRTAVCTPEVGCYGGVHKTESNSQCVSSDRADKHISETARCGANESLDLAHPAYGPADVSVGDPSTASASQCESPSLPLAPDVHFTERSLWALMVQHRRELETAVACGLGQNLTASNTVIYYSQQVFARAGISDAYWAGVGVGFVKVLGVVILMGLVHKGFRRRPLLIWGTASAVVCLAGMALCFVLSDKNGSSMSTAVPLVVLMLIYILGWNLSWAGLMTVCASEALPDAVRGVGMGLSIGTFWTCAFILQSSFELIIEGLSAGGAFFMFSGTASCLLIYLNLRMPETLETGRNHH